MCSIVSRVSQRIGILRLVNRIFEDTSVFIAFLHLFSKSLSIIFLCGDQLLNVTFSILSAGVFGGQVLSRSEFLVVVSSTSCGWA